MTFGNHIVQSTMSSDNGHSKNEEREDCLISQFPQSAMSPSTSRSPAQCIPVDGEMVSSQTSLVEGPGSHGHLVLTTWEKLMGIVGKDSIVSSVLIDGHSVDIASVVAVARYSARASIDGKLSIAEDIQASVVFLQRHLEEGHSVYGVTTGFGGSADTRTSHTAALQRGLLQHHLAGILPGQGHDNGSADSQWHEPTKPNGDQLALLAMPEAWVRGAMLVRANSLVRGHSAVRLSIIKNLVELLDRDLVPLVPLRGSISASGDLTPLCYIAGALDGNPDIKVWAGEGKGRKLVQANKALELAGLKRIELRAKEGLGILNGTAFSAAVASLAIYEANNLAVLSQVLTSMGVEALQGTAGSFDPFIAKVRPHQGQVEAARNIFSFLGGSSLADSRRGDQKDGALRQDRYALRTSSQWIGPQLEDLELAHKQLQVELNSTTDNPLIDPSGCHVHHGGNFQAAVVTSSTEKTRSALQMLGKMLFAQCTELLDVTRNNGLPPNLAPDDPSLSYLMKGVDINMASYMAELAFLSNPVSSHVQSAEMGNQAINSMALVSARYTHMAVDMVSLMCSAYLYCLCHALDLRAMQAQFEEKLLGTIEALTIKHLDKLLPSQGERRLVALSALRRATVDGLLTTITKDASTRFEEIAKVVRAVMIDHLVEPEASLDPAPVAALLPKLHAWTHSFATAARSVFEDNREAYYAQGEATPLLGMASKRLYKFVRSNLGVPFHRGLCDYPVIDVDKESKTTRGTHTNGASLANPGSWISVIHDALRSGRLMIPVMECLREVHTAQ